MCRCCFGIERVSAYVWAWLTYFGPRGTSCARDTPSLPVHSIPHPHLIPFSHATLPPKPRSSAAAATPDLPADLLAPPPLPSPAAPPEASFYHVVLPHGPSPRCRLIVCSSGAPPPPAARSQVGRRRGAAPPPASMDSTAAEQPRRTFSRYKSL